MFAPLATGALEMRNALASYRISSTGLLFTHPMSPEGAGRFSGRGNRGVGEQRGQANFVGVVA